MIGRVGGFFFAGVVIVGSIRMVYSYNPYLDPQTHVKWWPLWLLLWV